MAAHPKYKIMEVDIRDGKKTENIVSKYLMYKCDAVRVVKYKNSHDATFNDDNNQHFWLVVDKSHNPVHY